METSAPGWYVDPTGRHEFRYWTGSRWSDDVDDPTGPSSDPLEPLFEDMSPAPESLRGHDRGLRAPAAPDVAAIAATAGLELSEAEVSAASRRLARRRGRLATRREAAETGRRARLASGREAPEVKDAAETRRLVRGRGRGRLADADPGRGRHRPFLLVALVLGGLMLGGVVGGIVVIMMRTDPGQAAVSEPPDPLFDALSAYVVDTAMGAVTETDADCMARSIIESVGRDRLLEVGVDQGADPLTALRPEEVQTHLPVAMECLDDTSVEAMIARTLKPTVLSRFNASSGECLAQGWMEQLGRPTLVEVYALWASGASADLPAMLTPPELEVLATVLSTCSTESPTTTVP